MIISLTRFIGFGIGWGDYWFTIFLPFITIDFYKEEKGIKFINDWRL